MEISKALLDELLSGVERPEELLGDQGLIKELKVRLMERMLGAELIEHLGYDRMESQPAGNPTNANGATRKVLKGNDGAIAHCVAAFDLFINTLASVSISASLMPMRSGKLMA